MTEPLLCRTADGKIHWTTRSAGGGLVDSREYKTYCGQQVVSVIHEPITATDWYHNLNDEEKQHLKNVDKIMEGWGGELCSKCQNIREQEERNAWGF